ncbi:MAG TPA: hypothetical protein VNH17_08035 [Streptosporangiaceae bacterium]|nr:hypothetical protein [Streptosporangiaceae bacterium]
MTDTIWLRGEGGALVTKSLPLHFSLQDRLDKGELQRVNRDGSTLQEPPAGEAEPPAEPPADPVEDEGPAVPKRTASQADWAAYAVSQGMDAERAAGMKRDDLYKEYRRALRAVS